MLMVVAIITVLVALLFPALKRLQAVRNETACVGNLRQLGVGNALYAADSGNGEWAYYQAMNITSGNQGTWSSTVIWDNQWAKNWNGIGKTYPYIKDKSVYFCPVHRARKPNSLTLDWDNPSQNISGSYVARGYNQTWNVTTGNTENKIGKKLHQVGARAIASCFFMRVPGNPNYPLSWHDERWPVLYGDGSVRKVADPPPTLPTPAEDQNVWGTTSLQWRFWDYFDTHR